MKRFFAIVLIVLFAFSLAFSNGLSLNSVGTRALGMGGAFIGLANDATAIYWNPAGLAKIGSNTVVANVTDIIPVGSYSWEFPAMGINVDAKTASNHYISPNLFANYNMGDMTFGLAVYVPAGLGAEWDGADLAMLSGGGSLDWMSEIGVINISPAFAYKVADNFRVGLAVNIYYAMFDLKRPGGPLPDGSYVQYEENSTGMGYGVTVGALYDLNDKLSLGATFRTKTDVTMSGTATNPAFGAYGVAETDFDRDVSWPMWIGGGIAFKATDALTITADVQYSQWSESEKEFQTEFKEPVWVNATAATGDDKFVLNWKDATQIRVGAEYMVNDALALRGGYYYDPAPAPDETVNILFPSSTNNAFAAGGTYFMDKLAIDFAVEYLLGADREISADFANPSNPMEGFVNEMPGTHHLDVFAVTAGISYSF